MVDAETYLRDGDLIQALQQLQNRVRQAPSESKHRIFLFQLLSVLGQWDRAFTQLKVAGELDAGNLAMVQTYRQALRCEILREQVFAGERTPMVFGQPDPWVALMIEALSAECQGDAARAGQLRANAFEQAPATHGKIDNNDFQWIADADNRLGPILEAIVNGRYYWIPFQNIHKIFIDKPEDLRDLVWMPVHFTWNNGGEAVGLIPTRYADSAHSEDNLVRLARRTQWVAMDGDLYRGIGQRMLATDVGEYPIMDIRLIELDTLNMDSPTPESAEEASNA